MRSASIFALATLTGLAFFATFGRTARSTDTPPQTSPKSYVEPIEEQPRFTGDYEAAMAEKDRRVILVFSADWCPHCVSLKEHLKGMELGDHLVCIVDVDQHKDLKRKHSVRILPTSIIVEEGKEVSRNRGFNPEKYDEWFSSVK